MLYPAGCAQNASHRASEHQATRQHPSASSMRGIIGAWEETLTRCANRIHNKKKRIAVMATAWFWPVLTDLHQKFQLKIFPSNTTTSPLATPGWISAWWKLDKANLDKIRSMCLWHETKESSRHLPQQDFVQKTLLRTSYKYTEGYIFMLETYIWWRWPSLQNEIGKVRWWDCEVWQRKRAQTAFC